MQQRMDDDMQAIEVRDREIERRLDAYARARLSPEPRAVARTRARVMREARLQFEAARIAAHMASSLVLLPHRSTTRRLAMPFLAASIWLGIAAGTISAAQAGGPLYPTRMWIENATLPTSGVARAGAELSRLDARLFEATAAASRGDAGAVQAALDAYGQIADEATAAAIGDPALEAIVAAALDKHLAVAATLEGKGYDTTLAAVEESIERAIVHNQAVVDRLDSNGAGGAGNGSPGGPAAKPVGASGTGSGTGAGPSAGTDGGAGTGGGKPDKTPKPTPAPPDPQGQREHSPHGQSQ
jgi:hypothetical protein